MARIGDTKTQLLDAAYALMLSKGYPATSVDEICEQAGVSKGSFYHCFKSKEQLAIAMLEHHMADARDELERGLEERDLEGAARAIHNVRHIEQRSEEVWRDGCLIGAFALKLAESNP